MVKLEDYTIGELKKMVSSFNKLVKFSGYSKLKKSELIKMIRTHPKIKVEEGANAVKLSIKTDEDFEKQAKVKKEKVKKEVKKEVEKLDDVKVVVDVDKAKKAGIKIDTENPNIIIKKKEKAPAKNPLTTQEKNRVESLVDYMDKGFKIKGSDFSSGKDLNETITQLKFSKDKLKKNGKLEKALERFEKGKTKQKKEESVAKKEEPKNSQELYREQKKELDEKTLNMILKEDKDILLKPSDVDDPKQSKKIKKLYKKVFETYKKSYGDLLDKYNFSKSTYRKDASNNFSMFIKRARKEIKK